MSAGTAWWNHVVGVDDVFTRENGTRTFAVSELMVRPPWRKTGTAELLHEELLRERPEERATLLVDSRHHRVHALYETWGYEAVGRTKPFDDAPVMTAMVRIPAAAVQS
ncbi:GNAT family N-acetyltransferase [Streptomyces luteireticuli]|uniref:GNAT family N-acetyltransferase n=1 Tax=Streptomyces luteireticuli TaxID=173858 RepID=UPI003555F4DA